MKVYEISIETYTKKSLNRLSLQEKISKLISGYLAQDEKWLAYHQSKDYKSYSFDSLYPLSKDIYQKGGIYKFRIRTIDPGLANYLLDGFEDYQDDNFKNLTINVRELKKRPIEKLYSITPVILKNDFGYWGKDKDIRFFEKRITENLFKKYKYFLKEDLEEFSFYTNLVFKNDKPIAVETKDISLLGDKVELYIKGDKVSQDLAYLALATTFSENNALGCGFLGYRYL